MNNNHQTLRELALSARFAATPQKLLAFRTKASPARVLDILDELDHARNTLPAIRELLTHEIADFCASLGSPWRTGNTGSDAARTTATHRHCF